MGDLGCTLIGKDLKKPITCQNQEKIVFGEMSHTNPRIRRDPISCKPVSESASHLQCAFHSTVSDEASHGFNPLLFLRKITVVIDGQSDGFLAITVDDTAGVSDIGTV